MTTPTLRLEGSRTSYEVRGLKFFVVVSPQAHACGRTSYEVRGLKWHIYVGIRRISGRTSYEVRGLKSRPEGHDNVTRESRTSYEVRGLKLRFSLNTGDSTWSHFV